MLPTLPRFALLGLLATCPQLAGCILAPDESDCWDSSDAPTARAGTSVSVEGRALRADGAPLAGDVLLEDPPTLQDLFGAVLSLGLSCLREDLSGFDCSEYQRLALDAQGRFGFSLPEADTRGTLGFDRTFLLFAGLPSGPDGLARPSAVAWARLRKERVTLPALRLWEPALGLSGSGGALRVELAPPPELACAERTLLALELLDDQGRTFWSQAGTELDARVLEDATGTLSVRARFENQAWGSQVDVLELRTGAATFAGTAGPPPSRGAACTLDGVAHPADCPLSDGRMELVRVAGGQARLDLGAERALGPIVLRGSFSSLALSVSGDGQTWTALEGGLSGDSLFVLPPPSVRARHLRLQEGLDDTGWQRPLNLYEVSVW
jgi:hypothetical protein